MTSGSAPQDAPPSPASPELTLSTNEPQPSPGPPPPQLATGLGGLPLASWGSRCVAALIDDVIVAFPFVLAGALFVFKFDAAMRGRAHDEAVAIGLVAVGLGALLFLAVAAFYAPLLMARAGKFNGQTWGKEWMGIRAVRDNGQPWTFGSAALREIVVKGLAVTIASSLVPIVPLFVNYLWPMIDDQNRALHDIAVSSHVVRA